MLLRFLSALLLSVTILLPSGLSYPQASKPLSEADIVKLVELQIGDDVIAGKIKKDGINFTVDPQAIRRLESAGASSTILAMLQSVKPSQPAPGVAPAITYDSVLQLVKLGIDEDAIIKKIQSSPTLFTLDVGQEEELKQAGASQKVLDTLRSKRIGAISKSSDIGALALILDCSGSMRERTPDGETKMSAAKRVVGQLIDKLPNGIELTFIIYGHDAALECKAVKVVRQLASLDDSGKNFIRSVLSDLEPTGHTPIALALKITGEELVKTKKLSEIVLVTDGMETCHGNPAAEAQALFNKVNLKSVEVIGLAVSKQEQAGVESIARAGKGSFYGVSDAKGLAEAIKKTIPVVQELPPIPPSITTADSAISSITIKPLTHSGFPNIWQVIVFKSNGNPKAKEEVQRAQKLGDPMIVPAGNYDIAIYPTHNMNPLTVVSNLEVPEKGSVSVSLDRLLAGIVVNDLNLPNVKISAIKVFKEGATVDRDFSVQASGHHEPLGKTLLVLPDKKYLVAITPSGQRTLKIGEAQPKPGELVVFGKNVNNQQQDDRPNNNQVPSQSGPTDDATITSRPPSSDTGIGAKRDDSTSSVNSQSHTQRKLEPPIALSGTVWESRFDPPAKVNPGDLGGDGWIETLNFGTGTTVTLTNTLLERSKDGQLKKGRVETYTGTWEQDGFASVMRFPYWVYRGTVVGNDLYFNIHDRDDNGKESPGFDSDAHFKINPNQAIKRLDTSTLNRDSGIAKSSWKVEHITKWIDGDGFYPLTDDQLELTDQGKGKYTHNGTNHPSGLQGKLVNDSITWETQGKTLIVRFTRNFTLQGTVTGGSYEGVFVDNKNSNEYFPVRLLKVGASNPVDQQRTGTSQGPIGQGNDRLEQLISILKTGSSRDCVSAANELATMGKQALPAASWLAKVVGEDTTNKVRFEMIAKRIDPSRQAALIALAKIDRTQLEPALQQAMQSRILFTRLWAKASLNALHQNQGDQSQQSSSKRFSELKSPQKENGKQQETGKQKEGGPLKN